MEDSDKFRKENARHLCPTQVLVRVQSFSQDRFSVMSWEVEPPNETQHALGLVTHPQLFAPPELPLPCAVVSFPTILSSGTELSEM